MEKMSFPLGFKVRLHEKDLHICKNMAERFDVSLPIVEMTLIHYRRLIEQGHGDEDVSSLYRLKKAMFDSSER
jgi:3-hydroxyisobutyrate dehydrogenase